jgi:hypothetical protein
MQDTMQGGQSVPASAAALAARCSREALIRKIQTGELAGRLVGGRWVVEAGALAEYVRRANQPQASTV